MDYKDGENLTLGTLRRIIEELRQNETDRQTGDNNSQSRDDNSQSGDDNSQSGDDFRCNHSIFGELLRKYTESGVIYFLFFLLPSFDFIELQLELLRNKYHPSYPIFKQSIDLLRDRDNNTLFFLPPRNIDDLIQAAINSTTPICRFYAYAMGFLRRLDVIRKCIELSPTKDMISFIYDAVIGALDAGAEKEAMDICSMISRLPAIVTKLKLTKDITKSPTIFKYLVEHKYTSPFFAFKAALLSNNVELVSWIIPYLSEREVVMAYKLAYIRGDIDIAETLSYMKPYPLIHVSLERKLKTLYACYD
jgi:hypothetical protein